MVGKLWKNIHVENFFFRETVHSIPPLVFLLWGSSDYVNSERSDPHAKGSSLYGQNSHASIVLCAFKFSIGYKNGIVSHLCVHFFIVPFHWFNSLFKIIV